MRPGSPPSSPRRPPAVLILGAALAAALACGDPYVRTNPYDPNVPVQILISGPDTLLSYAQQAGYTATTIPGFSDSSIVWTVDTVTVLAARRDCCLDTIVDGGLFLKPAGAGTFQSIAPPLEPMTLTVAIGASVGGVDTTERRDPGGTVPYTLFRHSSYHSIVITQRLTRIQLRCPDTGSCDTLSAGGAWSVFVDGFDALGHGVYATTNVIAHPRSDNPVATLTVRDTTVATVSPTSIRAATVTARKSGMTWLVATRSILSLADSLRLVVR
jgi:hypothetical protein